MSKDTKQSMDPFTAELEKAGLKDIQEAIIWKLGDIVKSSETIAELSGNCAVMTASVTRMCCVVSLMT